MIKLLLLIAFAVQQPSDEDVRKMAANVTDYPTKFALVKIGRPALPALFDNFGSKDEWIVFESKSAIRWIVSYETDRKALGEALTPFTLESFSDNVRRFAIEMLGENGHVQTVGRLSALLDDEKMRDAALDALRLMKSADATRVLCTHLKKSPVEFKRKLLLAMGARHDIEITATLIDAAQDAETRDAALEALGLHGDLKAVPQLTEAAKSGSAIAHASLLKLKQADLAFELASTDEQKIAALKICDNYNVVKGAADEPALREAAFGALLRLADSRTTDTASDFLLVLSKSKSESNLVRALTGMGRLRDGDVGAVIPFLKHENASVRAAAVVALRKLPDAEATKALIEAEPTALICEALGARLDPAAVPALAKLVSSGDKELKRAAVRALGFIASPEAADALEEAAKGGDREALDAFMSIAEVSQQAKFYHRALALGAGDRALAGLARVGTIESVPAVEAALEKHRDAALACLVGIASRSPKDEALKLLKRAAELGAPDLDAKLRALGERIEITARDGKITDWWVIGPFDAPDEASWTKSEAPEKEIDLAKTYADLKWQPIAGHGETGVIDLDSFYKKNDNVAAYAYAEITLKKEHAGTLICGSDDGIVVWVNGEKVHEKLVPRGLHIDEDKAPIKLKEGANTILVKITEGGGGWEFHVRLVDEENRPLKFKIR